MQFNVQLLEEAQNTDPECLYTNELLYLQNNPKSDLYLILKEKRAMGHITKMNKRKFMRSMRLHTLVKLIRNGPKSQTEKTKLSQTILKRLT